MSTVRLFAAKSEVEKSEQKENVELQKTDNKNKSNDDEELDVTPTIVKKPELIGEDYE